MKRATFTVLFFVKRTKKQRDGKIPIFARLTINGQRVEFAVKRSVREAEWDKIRGRVKGSTKEAKQINAYIEAVRMGLNEARLIIEESRKELTALSVKNTYLGVNENKRTILEVFNEHNKRCKSLIGIDYAYGTYEKYAACYKHVKSFIYHRYKKNDIYLNDLSPAFIKDFEYFLKTERHCSHNTATKYLKSFKKITRISLSNGWMKKDPFAGIKFHLQEVDIDYLTGEELNILMNKRFVIDRVNRVKDVYLFYGVGIYRC